LFYFSFFSDSAHTSISSLSLHDALPIFASNTCPKRTKVRITVAASKYTCTTPSSVLKSLGKISGINKPTKLNNHAAPAPIPIRRSEEHTSELQSRFDLVCRLLLEQKKLL